jgi:hypothetical protein
VVVGEQNSLDKTFCRAQLETMNISRLTILIALGIWLTTFLIFVFAATSATVWIHWIGLFLVLFVPFMVPVEFAENLGLTLSLGWAIVITCVVGVAWIFAAVELWQRPKNSIALGLCIIWIACVFTGYYSLLHIDL